MGSANELIPGQCRVVVAFAIPSAVSDRKVKKAVGSPCGLSAELIDSSMPNQGDARVAGCWRAPVPPHETLVRLTPQKRRNLEIRPVAKRLLGGLTTRIRELPPPGRHRRRT